MVHFGLFLSFMAAAVSWAAGSQTPCTNREIAFVQSFLGTWNDLTYKRLLISNLSICSDSELVRVKDGSQSAHDELTLRDLFGGAPIVFRCADLLNCERPVQLSEIKARLEEKLKGRSFAWSFEQFKRSQAGQASTVSRSTVAAFRSQPSELPWFRGVVVKAGEPLSANALTPAGALAHGYDFDLCLHADAHDCGTSLPSSSKYNVGAAALPFGVLPHGVHVLYRVAALDGDDVPLRTEDRVLVLAIPPSQPEEGLAAIRASLALAWLDLDSTPGQLSSYAAFLTRQTAKRAESRP